MHSKYSHSTSMYCTWKNNIEFSEFLAAGSLWDLQDDIEISLEENDTGAYQDHHRYTQTEQHKLNICTQ